MVWLILIGVLVLMATVAAASWGWDPWFDGILTFILTGLIASFIAGAIGSFTTNPNEFELQESYDVIETDGFYTSLAVGKNGLRYHFVYHDNDEVRTKNSGLVVIIQEDRDDAVLETWSRDPALSTWKFSFRHTIEVLRVPQGTVRPPGFLTQ